MRRLILVCIFLLTSWGFSQSKGIFGTNTSPKDSSNMISSAADSVTGRWLEYYRYQTKQGYASLFVGIYSGTDGLSVSVTVKYQLSHSLSEKGDDLRTKWITLTTITNAQRSRQAYGSGSQNGELINMTVAANPWQVHRRIRFKYLWTPVALDTAAITSRFDHITFEGR